MRTGWLLFPCVLKEAGDKGNHDDDCSKIWMDEDDKKKVPLCSIVLKSEFPGSGEGDSQIVADEKGTGNSNSLLP